ncbi:hypothetical protein EYF80_027591 [Liparis tanakae]|uniref:Uncharacterized protein n=1 Tax=Liparis tanakae TaxID=230148 RepID=A0A4Z2H9D1_9TELE|nr:hypothetical protein EYF80_027591 [Liparis tanakae]
MAEVTLSRGLRRATFRGLRVDDLMFSARARRLSSRLRGVSRVVTTPTAAGPEFPSPPGERAGRRTARQAAEALFLFLRIPVSGEGVGRGEWVCVARGPGMLGRPPRPRPAGELESQPSSARLHSSEAEGGGGGTPSDASQMLSSDAIATWLCGPK